MTVLNNLPNLEVSLSVKGWWEGGSGREEVRTVAPPSAGACLLTIVGQRFVSVRCKLYLMLWQAESAIVIGWRFMPTKSTGSPFIFARTTDIKFVVLNK